MPADVFTRTMRYCLTCHERPTPSCTAQGHTIEKREGDIWWYRLKVGRRVVMRSTHTDNKTEARQILAAQRGDQVKGTLVLPARVRFEDALARVKAKYQNEGQRSLGDVERRAKLHLTPTFGGLLLADISLAAVEHYIDTRRKAGASNGTINRELAILKLAFRLAQVTRPPFKMLKEKRQPKQGFFERHEFEAVRRHMPEDLRGLVTFYYVTGWRKQEALGLKWSAVNFHTAEVRLAPEETKTDDARVFTMTTELRAALKAQERRAKGEFVFHRNGKAISDLRGAWAIATKKAGCPEKTIHDFRRTAVRNLERAGVPRSVAMAMVGHRTHSVYERYAIADAGQRQEAVAKMDRLAASDRKAGRHSRGTVVRIRIKRSK